jgi:hypothetical protein
VLSNADAAQHELTAERLATMAKRHGLVVTPEEPTAEQRMAVQVWLCEPASGRDLYEVCAEPLRRAYDARPAHLVPSGGQAVTARPLPAWNTGAPTAPGVYVGSSDHPERTDGASIYVWDGSHWRHWSGAYDHLVTHWMPTDLPTPAAQEPKP